MAKFDYNDGRGSKAHKDFLKKEIKIAFRLLSRKDLFIVRISKMNLEQLNDLAEDLLQKFKTDKSDETIKYKIKIVMDLLKEVTSRKH